MCIHCNDIINIRRYVYNAVILWLHTHLQKKRAKQLDKLKRLGTWAKRFVHWGCTPVMAIRLSNNTAIDQGCWHRQKTVGCDSSVSASQNKSEYRNPKMLITCPPKEKNTSPETVFSVRFTTPLGPIRTQQTHEPCATNRGMGLIPISYGNLTHWYYIYIPSRSLQLIIQPSDGNSTIYFHDYLSTHQKRGFSIAIHVNLPKVSLW